MPYWFAVFFVVFVTFMCLLSVVTGAFIMWCREQKTNPLAAVRQAAAGTPAWEKDRDKEMSFYE